MEKRMKIGILQTGHAPEELSEEHGDYTTMFSNLLDGHDFEYKTYSIVDGIFPESINECNAWLITGSKHGAYEDFPWIPPLEELICDIYAANIPMVGICFGHQIMAQTLGGKVEKFGGLWGVGTNEYNHPDGTTTKLQAMHQDQVVKLPPDTEVIASSDFCKYAGIAYKNKALSYQAHPEFTPRFTEQLIKLREGTTIPLDQSSAALKRIHEENDSEKYADVIARFLKDI